MSSYRRRIGTLAALALIATVIAALSLDSSVAAPVAQTPDITALVNSVDQQRITDHVAAIDEPRNALGQPAQLLTTADYLEAQLSSFGYPVTLDPVAFNATTFPNVIGVQQGTVCPERVFIVGAHYDSVSTTPGADDDASGTAAMLEIARVLAGPPLPAPVGFTGLTLADSGLLGRFHMAPYQAAADPGVGGVPARGPCGGGRGGDHGVWGGAAPVTALPVGGLGGRSPGRSERGRRALRSLPVAPAGKYQSRGVSPRSRARASMARVRPSAAGVRQALSLPNHK